MTTDITTMKKITTLIAISAILAGCCQQQEKFDGPVYRDVNAPIEDRVEDAIGRMTLEEKIAMVHAQSKFSSPGVPRLGIPEVWCTDGPHGIRTEVLWDEWVQAGWTNDSCTAFPALTCLAATWDRDMSALYGKSIGEEALYRGKSVLLGPGVNIYRTPLNGRNFEYLGEDPFLSSQMVVPYIKGVQDQGVASCVKHFAMNNQETNRYTVSVQADDRTMYEIYLPAFKAAVQQAGVWSIMPAYNLIDGQHCAHNSRLLQTILRDEWGFDGVTISDWGATQSTEEAVENGLDLEFGTWTDGMTMGATNTYDQYYMAAPYLELIKKGVYGTEELDAKVRNILRLIFRTKMSGNTKTGSLNSDEHILAARTIAREGIVLLKNDNNVLPINAQVKKIAVIGENAIKKMTVGGGSSSLKVKKEVSPLEGITAMAGNNVQVVYARGYVGDVNTEYNGVVSGQSLEDKRPADVIMAEALAVAKDADVVLFFGGLNKADNQDCEGADRLEMDLPYAQDELIEALAEANPNLAVIIISGNGVAMPWVDKVSTVLQGWYCGSEAGNAIADVVFGKVNPSGKLPFTMTKRLEDFGAHALGAYPGDENLKEEYSEGIFVGYRWMDKNNIEPLFPFGHGLSYTSFEYDDISINKSSFAKDGSVEVSVNVRNTGKLDGKEVVQLYITDNESRLERPEKELKGFEKVMLKAGETKKVTFTIDKTMLQYFDPDAHDWVVEPGDFVAHVAASSRDIRGSVGFSYGK